MIQVSHVDINELKTARKHFTQDEWLDLMLQSIGQELTALEQGRESKSQCLPCILEFVTAV